MKATILVFAGILVAISYLEGHSQGRKSGIKEALSTNPVSEALETTCLGLWMGEQTKKAREKNK